MSRALYHLSYGTAERDPSGRLALVPSACASSAGALQWPLASACSYKSRSQMALSTEGSEAGVAGCGAWIRTKDLRVMSPTSCRCSTPRLELYPQPSRPQREGDGDAGTAGVGLGGGITKYSFSLGFAYPLSRSSSSSAAPDESA